MSEDVYTIPDLTKKVRYGRRERQQEMEERGEREERIVDIYASADNPDPGPGAQQDAVQQNTAQQQNGACESKKNNAFRAAAVSLLCAILLAVIIVLVKYSYDVKDRDQLLSNQTKHNDDLQSRYNELKSRYDNLTKQNDADEQKRPCGGSPEWKKFGKGYYISSEMKTWEESREFCIGIKSDLLVIKNEAKQDFVDKVVNISVERGQNVWLGLSHSDGVWKWVDGTLATSQSLRWRSGEPNGKGKGNCAVFHNAVGSQRGWNDILCSTRMFWICERLSTGKQ